MPAPSPPTVHVLSSTECQPSSGVGLRMEFLEFTYVCSTASTEQRLAFEILISDHSRTGSCSSYQGITIVCCGERWAQCTVYYPENWIAPRWDGMLFGWSNPSASTPCSQEAWQRSLYLDSGKLHLHQRHSICFWLWERTSRKCQ